MPEGKSPLEVFNRYVEHMLNREPYGTSTEEVRQAIRVMTDEMAALKEKERARSKIIDTIQKEDRILRIHIQVLIALIPENAGHYFGCLNLPSQPKEHCALECKQVRSIIGEETKQERIERRALLADYMRWYAEHGHEEQGG